MFDNLRVPLKSFGLTLLSLSKLGILAFYTILLGFFGLFVLILPTKKRTRGSMMLIQFWSRIICLLFGIRVSREGSGLPFKPGFLVVANHMSYFDIITVGSVIPSVFLAKAQIRYWPIVGLGAMMVGTLFVKRKSKESRSEAKEEAIERLKRGQNVCIFPEGTTTDGTKLLPFRYGAFDIAMKANRPVVPVAINYARPDLIRWQADISFFSHIVRLGKQGTVDVRLHISPAVGPQSYANAEEFAQAVWQKLNASLIHFGMRTLAQLASIDWHDFVLNQDASKKEISDFMVRTLSLLVQVDSSSAAGERQVCQILRKILGMNGHAAEVLLSPNGHSNLLATHGKPIKDGAKDQNTHVVLLSNSDVVATGPDGWLHPPFSGAFADDFVWGRGTIDMKGLIAVYLAAFLTADDSTPVQFLCVADDEHGGHEGAGFIAADAMHRLRPKVILGEGGFGMSNLLGATTPIFLVDTAEKGSLWLKLSVDMKTSSHSAVPPEEYPLEVLTRAINRAAKMENEFILLPVTEAFLGSLSEHSPLVSRLTSRAVKVPFIRGSVTSPLEKYPYIRAMFRNTLAATRITSGQADNVLAGHVEAILDCRLLPGMSGLGFVAKLERLVDDERVQIRVLHHANANESDFNDPHFKELTSAITEVCPGALVTPFLLPAHTSLGHFRELGIPCFGIFPGLFKQESLNLIHGDNERVSIEQLDLAYEIILKFINRYAGS